MTEPTQDSAAANATALLVHYGFDLGGYKAEELVTKWLNNYQAHWVRLGVIEALYQGRYKSVSVEQILSFWQRRGQALHHFNHDFERLICRKFPRNLTDKLTPQAVGEDTPQESENLEMSSYTGSSIAASLRHRFTGASATSVQELQLPSQETDTSSQSPEEVHPSLSVTLTTPANPPSPSSSLLAPGYNQDDVPAEPLVDTDEPAVTLQQHSDHHKVAYKPDWSRWEATKHPIDQFTPPPDLSDFYLKLKSVAQQGEDLSEENVSLERGKPEEGTAK